MTTAKEIKKNFAVHFLEKYVVANESSRLAYSDIVAIDRDLNAREYEIKVSLSDLRRELAEIDYALTHLPPDGFVNFVDNKKSKHNLYINGLRAVDKWIRDTNHFFCPSTFSFLISEELYRKEKQRLDTLPYGVMDSETFHILKPAKHLKEAKAITARQLWSVTHSQCYKLIGGDLQNPIVVALRVYDNYFDEREGDESFSDYLARKLGEEQ